MLLAILAFLFKYSKLSIQKLEYPLHDSRRAAGELTVDRHFGAAWVASGGNQEACLGVPTGKLSVVLKRILQRKGYSHWQSQE
jgi:hypothetical protein